MTKKGVTLDLILQDGGAQERLRSMIERMADKRGFYTNVGEHLLRSTHQNFDKETAPDGKKWQPLSRGRIRQRESKRLTPVKILRARGWLKGSVRYQADDDSLQWGAVAGNNGEDYAAIHQLGGSISIPARQGVVYRHYNPKNGKSTGRFVKKKNKNRKEETVTFKEKTVNIPARPYLGISESDQQAILSLADRWLADGR